MVPSANGSGPVTSTQEDGYDQNASTHIDKRTRNQTRLKKKVLLERMVVIQMRV